MLASVPSLAGGFAAGIATGVIATTIARAVGGAPKAANPPEQPGSAARDAWLQQAELTFQLYREFLEWRHKIMTRVVVVVGASLLATRWLYEHQGANELGAGAWVRATPLAAAAALSFVAALLDAVHQKMLNACYARGRHAEQSLDVKEGLFDELASAFDYRHYWQPGLNYRFILGVSYLTLAIALAAGATYVWTLNSP